MDELYQPCACRHRRPLVFVAARFGTLPPLAGRPRAPAKRTRREEHALFSSSADEFRPAIPRSGWSPPEPIRASLGRTGYYALPTCHSETGTFYFAGKRNFLLRHRWTAGLATTNFPGPEQRCQAMTVSGLTMTKEDQSIQTSHSHAQRSRSADVSFGRFTERRKTPSWCRSARFSKCSAARDLKTADTEAANT